MSQDRRGRVEHIHITPDSGEDMQSKERIEAVAHRGLRGDRYFHDRGVWSKLDNPGQLASEVTLIEAEAIEAIERDYDIHIEPGQHRRNVTTRDTALNQLVDQTFQVGDAVVKGLQLCEPCGYMQALVAKDNIAQALTHRGGLDAEIVESGTIEVGDPIVW